MSSWWESDELLLVVHRGYGPQLFIVGHVTLQGDGSLLVWRVGRPQLVCTAVWMVRRAVGSQGPPASLPPRLPLLPAPLPQGIMCCACAEHTKGQAIQHRGGGPAGWRPPGHGGWFKVLWRDFQRPPVFLEAVGPQPEKTNEKQGSTVMAGEGASTASGASDARSSCDDYEALEAIGKGSFGTVTKIRRKSDGKVRGVCCGCEAQTRHGWVLRTHRYDLLVGADAVASVSPSRCWCGKS